MIQKIDGASFIRMMQSAAANVENNKQLINDLNVFPVPDGDTGTNMTMTLNNGIKELEKLSACSVSKAADSFASALLRGARGNSGVILSLLFRGFSKAWKGLEEADGKALSAALTAGMEAAYAAIMKPANGTILSVSRDCANQAKASLEQSEDFEAVLEAALDSAAVSLSESTMQNPVLKKAGVVDAGGKGFLCILEAMMSSLRGKDIPRKDDSDSVKAKADFSDFAEEDIHFSYCTEFIVSRENFKNPDVLHDYLSGMGDCLVQVNDSDIIKVHIHTNEPGNVLTHALEYGSLLTVKIENMKEQHTSKVLSDSEKAPKVAAPEKKYGIVSVCAGPGLAAAFRDLGADQIVDGGQTMNPSTEDILKAINLTPAEIVYVFPNNGNIILAAEQAVPLSEKKVIVIRTKTVPQGITALLNFDPELSEGMLTETFTEAFANVDTMQITYAARDSEYDGMHIAAGEYLGLYNGALFKNSSDVKEVLASVAKKAYENAKDYITIYYGANISEEKAAEEAAAAFESYCPDAEVSLVNGGQPVYYYLISAE